MRNRTSNGIERSFVFGDEGSQSTGATSLSVAIKCLSITLKEDKDSLAILDEPDVGLSDYYNFVYPVFSEKRPFVEIIKQERPIQAMRPFSITIYDDSFFTHLYYLPLNAN